MKMVKLFEELVIGNEAKEQKGKYLSMLFGAVGASLLGSMLTGKRVIRTSKTGCFMLPHALTNFEIEKYQNEPRFNCFYSRNNLLKIKDGEYVINFDEYKSKGNHLIAL